MDILDLKDQILNVKFVVLLQVNSIPQDNKTNNYDLMSMNYILIKTGTFQLKLVKDIL